MLNMFEKRMTLEITDQHSLVIRLMEEGLDDEVGGGGPGRRATRPTLLDNVCLSAELLMRRLVLQSARTPDTADPLLEELNIFTTGVMRARRERLLARPNSLEAGTHYLKQYLCCASTLELLGGISRRVADVPTTLQLVVLDPFRALIQVSIGGGGDSLRQQRQRRRITVEVARGALRVLLPSSSLVQMSPGDLVDYFLGEMAEWSRQ